MQTNNKQRAANFAAATPKDGYKVSPATAKLLDCIRAGQQYYDMIAAAMVEKYGGIMPEDEAEAKAVPFLAAISDITDMLHDEITGSVVDALSVANGKAPDVVNI